MPLALSSGAEAGSRLAPLARALREGRTTAVRCAEAMLAACEAQSHLNAFHSVQADSLLQAARAADEARARGLPIGPLHGVPVGVKDNIDATPHPTTAGTAALRRFLPASDAAVVRRLRAAGALVAGKTAMHELAMGWTGQNASFGDTRNPRDPRRMAGGSSGGSACAVGAGWLSAAIGTDTNGSIRLPGSFCGVVGLRPTHGRYPFEGVFPLAPSLDTVGPMAATVEDVALLDAVMSGTQRLALEPVDVQDVRLGVCQEGFWDRLDGDVASAAEHALHRLRAQGVTLVPVALPGLPELLDDTAPALITHEAGPAWRRFLADAGGNAPALPHLLQSCGHDLAPALAALEFDADAPRYRAALAKRNLLRALWQQCFESHRLDALIHPASRVTAPLIGEHRVSPGPEVPTRYGAMSAREAFARNVTPASLAGAPSLVVPLPTDGLPVGMLLDGLPGNDRRLLAIGAALARILPREG
jgi:mandelamide amidase